MVFLCSQLIWYSPVSAKYEDSVQTILVKNYWVRNILHINFRLLSVMHMVIIDLAHKFVPWIWHIWLLFTRVNHEECHMRGRKLLLFLEHLTSLRLGSSWFTLSLCIYITEFVSLRIVFTDWWVVCLLTYCIMNIFLVLKCEVDVKEHPRTNKHPGTLRSFRFQFLSPFVSDGGVCYP